jgi:hypothetical protein
MAVYWFELSLTLAESYVKPADFKEQCPVVSTESGILQSGPTKSPGGS